MAEQSIDGVKRCPFCGGEPTFHANDWCDPPEWSVHCSRCFAGSRGNVIQADAIAAWNRRPSLDALEAQTSRGASQAELVEALTVVTDGLEAYVTDYGATPPEHVEFFVIEKARALIAKYSQGDSPVAAPAVRAEASHIRLATSCPRAGYDQLGASHYCLDCSKHWYGDTAPCSERDCPFLARRALDEEKAGG